MVRLGSMPEWDREYLTSLPCPSFETDPWAEGPPLAERRIAIVSTAGLQRRDEPPFKVSTTDYRVIPGDVEADDLVMSHISVNFDRSGFQQDLNVVFPIDRLNELAAEGVIGSVADFHYAFMGATEPHEMEPQARRMAGLLKGDGVTGVLMVPV